MRVPGIEPGRAPVIVAGLVVLRFVLQQRLGRRSFIRVAAPGLGVWHRSAPGRRGFVWAQKVRGLFPASAYRAVVQFRWYDAAGNRLRSAVRRSPVCPPIAPPANLRATSLARFPGPTAGTSIYTFEVTNTGGSVDLDPELSWNYEVGLRSTLRPGVRLDATVFRVDYENQIVPGSLAGGVGVRSY